MLRDQLALSCCQFSRGLRGQNVATPHPDHVGQVAPTVGEPLWSLCGSAQYSNQLRVCCHRPHHFCGDRVANNVQALIHRVGVFQFCSVECVHQSLQVSRVPESGFEIHLLSFREDKFRVHHCVRDHIPDRNKQKPALLQITINFGRRSISFDLCNLLSNSIRGMCQIVRSSCHNQNGKTQNDRCNSRKPIAPSAPICCERTDLYRHVGSSPRFNDSQRVSARPQRERA